MYIAVRCCRLSIWLRFLTLELDVIGVVTDIGNLSEVTSQKQQRTVSNICCLSLLAMGMTSGLDHQA